MEDYFSEDFDDELFGKMKLTSYIFKTKIEDRSVKGTKDTIRREFFKNNMSVLFSVNGQVHGHYTYEFITRSLKLSLLKNHLLIHIDCTNMDYNFRKELFMASRDRLKDGEETRQLRRFLAEKLGSKNGRLAEIEKRRKDSIAVESEDARELIKSFTQNLPMSDDWIKLLNQTLKLEQERKEKRKEKKGKEGQRKRKDAQAFNPQRFPSFFKRSPKNEAEREIVAIPIDDEKPIPFDTDVENHYFDRIEEPGDLQIALLDFKTNESQGGNAPGKIDQIEDVFNACFSSPQDGTVKIHLSPKTQVNVGDAAKIKVSLNDPSGEFEEIFWVKISEAKAPKQTTKRTEEENQNLGLPEVILAHQEQKDNAVTWEQVEEATSEIMNHSTVLYPMAEGEKLEKIYINMDSRVLKNFKSGIRTPNEEQLEIADRKYIASVYLHTLFLYCITVGGKYKIMKEEEDTDNYVPVGSYLKDLFENHYSEFILKFNFGTEDAIMQLLED